MHITSRRRPLRPGRSSSLVRTSGFPVRLSHSEVAKSLVGRRSESAPAHYPESLLRTCVSGARILSVGAKRIGYLILVIPSMESKSASNEAILLMCLSNMMRRETASAHETLLLP